MRFHNSSKRDSKLISVNPKFDIQNFAQIASSLYFTYGQEISPYLVLYFPIFLYKN